MPGEGTPALNTNSETWMDPRSVRNVARSCSQRSEKVSVPPGTWKRCHC